MKKKRELVVVLSTIFYRGGIPRFNQMLCMALNELAPKLGLQVTVLSQDDSLEDYRSWNADWSNLRFVPGGGQLRLSLRTLAICIRQRPDMMLIGLMGMTPLGLVCRPFLRDGYGFVAHGFECWGDSDWSDRRLSRRVAARRARFVFSVSDYTGRELSRLTGIPADAIHLLPNTLEPQFDSFVGSAKEQGRADRLEILTVSRLDASEHMKGVDHSITALKNLAELYPGLIYNIVGKGSDKPRLIDIAEQLGLAERVNFLQDLSDEELAEHYKRCDIFLLPSGQEGFGIVFLEAMRFAKPCIGGNAGGTPEVIEDGRTGLLVPYGEPAAIEQALDRLFADPELRMQMGRNGLERLEQHFTFEKFRQNLEDHLISLLEL